MKKRWTILVAILVIVGITALSTYDNNKRQETATEQIINKAAQVDKIKISNTKDSVTIKGEAVKPYIEKTPLVHIEKYERNDRDLFDKEPTYTIQYFVKDEELYSVKLLAMKEKPSDDHLDDFLINEHLLVKWADYQMMFSQHEQIEKSIAYFQKHK